jgi:methanogenic corrinoid protein MtbC1
MPCGADAVANALLRHNLRGRGRPIAIAGRRRSRLNALNDIAAELLETSAAGYAAAALAEWRKTDSPSDGAALKTHLTQRVLELAAAVRVGEPALFARRVQWLKRAAQARGTGERELERALASLRAALETELPANLKPAVRPAFELAFATLGAAPASERSRLDPSQPNERLALRYLSLCLEGKPDEAASCVLHALDDGLRPSELYTALLAAEKEVGELWHVGDVSVAEERLVSETTRELMALIVARAARAQPQGFTVLAASITGNAHDIGLRAAADLFRIAGWRCLYLGANVPAKEIGTFAAGSGVDLVLLSATLMTQLKSLAEAVATVRALAPRCKILVGGLAFDDAPQLWRDLGADAHAATIAAAVEIGTALVARG